MRAKSESVCEMIAVYKAPVVRRHALHEFHVRSKSLDGNGGDGLTTSYVVMVQRSMGTCDGKRVLQITCDCRWARLGPRGRKPCVHVKAVLKRLMPTASIWLSAEDAKRQRRRWWPFIFMCDPLAVNGTARAGAQFFVTERRPGRRKVRGLIR